MCTHWILAAMMTIMMLATRKRKMRQLPWKTVWWFLTEFNRVITWPSSFMPRYVPKRSENTYTHRNLYTNIYNRIICNIQTLETIQMSIDRWMDKQIVYIIQRNITQSWKRKVWYRLQLDWILKTWSVRLLRDELGLVENRILTVCFKVTSVNTDLKY